MFDPTVGRFTSEDPAGFGPEDPNLYRYVRNSPTNASDPSGLDPTPLFDPSDIWADKAHSDAHLKPLTPDRDYQKLMTDKVLKLAKELYGAGSQNFKNFSAKLAAKEVFAGQDVGATLKKAAEVLAKDVRAMPDDKRAAMIKMLYGSVLDGTVAWDIGEMVDSEHQTAFTSGKYGDGPARIFITVNGEVHFAGAVNYWYWGRLNRLLYEAEQASPDWTKYNNAKFIERWPEKESPTGGKFLCTDKGFLHMPHEKLNFHGALTSMILYRKTFYRIGQLEDLGIQERFAWIQAGWFNDLKYASPFKLNSIINPSPEKYTKSLLFRVSNSKETLYGKNIWADGRTEEVGATLKPRR